MHRLNLSLRTLALAGLCCLLAAGCGNAPSAPEATVSAAAPAAAAAPPPAPPPVAVPYEQAVAQAARDLFRNAKLPAGSTHALVIDPLVDGNTGIQTTGTRALEKRVSDLVAAEFPSVQIKPFSAANVAAAPLIFIGTFTPINLLGKSEGERDAFRVCFALADLKTGKIVSKGFARSQTAGIDATPLPYFKDAPVWVTDKAVQGYIRTCQGTKAGDPINPDYYDKVALATGIGAAIDAYNAKDYREALTLFTALQRGAGGEQPRVQTGLYLANLRLARTTPAISAFGKLVEQGIAGERLAVNFNFRPGEARFAADRTPYDRWLREIARLTLPPAGRARAQQAADAGRCYEIAGHTGRAGSAELNERLSQQRAEYVKQRLVALRREADQRFAAKGYGARQPLVGTASDDDADLLDRRTEFKPQTCDQKA